MRHAPLALAALMAASVAASSAQAARAAGPRASAPAGRGQGPLVVEASGAPGSLSILACAKTTCSSSDLRPVTFPVAPPAGADPAKAQLSVLTIGTQRSLVRVELNEPGRSWTGLLAASVDGTATPVAIWSGNTGEPRVGEADTSTRIEVSEGEDGASTVLVGEVRRELGLCGRPALLSPRLVDPSDLALKPVKMQRLSRAERDKAETVTAQRAQDPFTPLGRVLSAMGASSAIGSPSALTDGDPETVWSEGRGSEGRGEFVTMRAPSEVAITGFSLIVRPANQQVDDGAAPRKLWIAVDGRLIGVTMPEDAWKAPGGRYLVQLASPVRSSCVALVLDDAFVGKDAKKAAVSLAEVTAVSEFDGRLDLAGLVGAMAGGGARAQAAAAVLARGGEAARKAVSARYGELDESGRMLAWSVMDGAPCAESSRFFAPLLRSTNGLERKHAHDRIERCGRASAPALAEAFDRLPQGQRWELAEEMASLAPELAVDRLAPLLAKGDPATRARVRKLLARTTKQPRGMRALGKLLDDTSLAPVASVDLLRAASARLQEVGLPARASFARMVRQPNLDLRTRYLLCEPAARLAANGDAAAVRFLYDRILHDPEPMIRAHAVRVAHDVPELVPSALFALENDHVRVRDSATWAVRDTQVSSAPPLIRRLILDPWPMVRAHAVDALATLGASSQADDALHHALSWDESPRVRARVAAALGERGVRRAAPQLRERADDNEEFLDVRVRSVVALGRVCDRSAVDFLTVLARRAADPYGMEFSHQLGVAAIVALGRIHPRDLGELLKPVIEGKATPREVRAAAQAALSETDVCK
ncbi:MAG TPA: HEAT repeat domain-containing protein [Polyangiaceae bacterium]|nr:HEAT repeat domain-containing protein [Polyangiaceae bacterium]